MAESGRRGDQGLLVNAQSDAQLYAAFGQYNAEVLKEQFDYIVNYRPAPAANRTAQQIQESLGYTSGFARSKTDHERGTSEGESEQKIALMPDYETKLLRNHHVIVQNDGERSTIAKRLNWHDFPELEQRGNLPSPTPSPVPQPSPAFDRHNDANHHGRQTTLWHRERKLPVGYIDPDKRY